MSEPEKRLKLAIIIFGVGFGFLVLAACGAWMQSSHEQTNYEGWSWFFRFINGDPEATETLIEKLEEDMESQWPEVEEVDYTPTYEPGPDASDSFYEDDQWQYE